MNIKPTIVDLFCGCGGFGLGAELAGFRTIAAVDIDETLQSAYKKNFPNTNVVNADLSLIAKREWNDILGHVKVDGVIGGPPCQGYSRMGASNPSDPRRHLLLEFFRHVNILNPRFFIMENVEGLMDKKNLGQLQNAIAVLKKKYTVLKPLIIDASQWGAPTKRKRVIVIGFDSKRMGSINLSDLSSSCSTVTVRDAIRDIIEPIKQVNNNTNYGWASYRTSKNLSGYAKKMREFPPAGLGSKESLKYLQLGELSGNFDTVHSDKVKRRYKEIEQGKTDPISRSKKLEWSGLCPTLRAGTGSDKGSYQAVRPIHPQVGRVITVREAARLQGFPDWFCFHQTKWHSFRMIGNSVSPIVSEALLSILFKKIAQKPLKMTA